jgi:hypothetical protein
MSAGPFDPLKTEPIDLPEPYGSMLAFLSDLHEQIETFGIGQPKDEFRDRIVEQLEQTVVALSLMVTVKGGAPDT